MARDVLRRSAPSKKPYQPSPFSETRCHPRFPVALPVQCRERDKEAPRHWRGRTADVSGGGFAIEVPAKLPPGTKLTIEVRTGIGPMRGDAEVLYARKVPGEGVLYRHGLRLADGSQLLDLPVGVLLGEWLRKMAKTEGKAARARRPSSCRPAGRKTRQ